MSEEKDLPWEYFEDHECPDNKRGCLVYHTNCWRKVPEPEARRLLSLETACKELIHHVCAERYTVTERFGCEQCAKAKVKIREMLETE